MLVAVLFVSSLSLASEVAGQANRLLPVEDWAYVYVQRLQRRGHLLDLHPTALPYRQGAVAAALQRLDRSALSPIEARWVDLLDGGLGVASRPTDQAAIGAALGVGATFIDTDRLDLLRPTDAGDPPLQLGTVRLYPRAGLRLYAEAGRGIAHLGLQHDVYYDADPDGLDAVNRLMTRSEDSYLGYGSPYFSAYLGRFSHLWGRPEEPALLVSANPRSYDHLSLRVGGARLALRSLLGELDSSTQDGRFTGRAADDSVRAGSDRRFLSAHRLDWRPSRHVALSLMEAVLFSGPNSSPSLKFANPLHLLLFEVDNTPKNDENNGLVAGMLWLYIRALTLHGQLLLDDFDFLNGTEPASVALTGSLTYAGLAQTLDVGTTLTLVTARTYNTHQPEGRYLYLNRGLATQFSDYVHLSLFADAYLDQPVPGLMVTPRLDVLWQGEADLRQPYPAPDEIPALLAGTPVRTIRPALQLYYQLDPRWWIRFDYGVNLVANENHQDGASRSRGQGLLSFGLRLSLDESASLGFREHRRDP